MTDGIDPTANTPTSSDVDAVGDDVIFGGGLSARDLLDENERLQRTIDELRMENARLRSQRDELLDRRDTDR